MPKTLKSERIRDKARSTIDCPTCGGRYRARPAIAGGWTRHRDCPPPPDVCIRCGKGGLDTTLVRLNWIPPWWTLPTAGWWCRRCTMDTALACQPGSPAHAGKDP